MTAGIDGKNLSNASVAVYLDATDFSTPLFRELSELHSRKDGAPVETYTLHIYCQVANPNLNSK